MRRPPFEPLFRSASFALQQSEAGDWWTRDLSANRELVVCGYDREAAEATNAIPETTDEPCWVAVLDWDEEDVAAVVVAGPVEALRVAEAVAEAYREPAHA